MFNIKQIDSDVVTSADYGREIVGVTQIDSELGTFVILGCHCLI